MAEPNVAEAVLRQRIADELRPIIREELRQEAEAEADDALQARIQELEMRAEQDIQVKVNQFLRETLSLPARAHCPLTEYEQCITRGHYSNHCRNCVTLSELLDSINAAPEVLEEAVETAADKRVKVKIAGIKKVLEVLDAEVFDEFFIEALRNILRYLFNQKDISHLAASDLDLLSDKDLTLAAGALLIIESVEKGEINAKQYKQLKNEIINAITEYLEDNHD